MTGIPKGGSTIRQKNYALKAFAGTCRTKKEAALDVGYPSNVASSVKSKIENTKGYKNAMIEILTESDNLVLNIMGEFKRRGFEEFSNRDLTRSIEAIGNAWSKFNGINDAAKKVREEETHNKLRTVVLQQIEHQTVNNNVPTEVKQEPIDAEFKEAEIIEPEF